MKTKETEPTYTAFGEYVILKMLTPDEKSKGGIVLPETANKPKRGQVVSIGPAVPKSYLESEHQKHARGVCVGDIVHLVKSDSDGKKLDGGYLSINHIFIVAIEGE